MTAHVSFHLRVATETAFTLAGWQHLAESGIAQRLG